MSDPLESVLRTLTSPPEPVASSTLDAPWWARVRGPLRGLGSSVERAVVAGSRADGVGPAFAAGYQFALHRVLPAAGVFAEKLTALCVTERGGGHPRAIETTLKGGPGEYTLRGTKRFVTMGQSAELLAVLASRGEAEGRKEFVVAVVPSDRAGITFRAAPATPFVPEVPHAEVDLADVAVRDTEVMRGDGYADIVKPFRTVEDCHVVGAVLGYVCASAHAHGFDRAVREALLAQVVAFLALGAADPHGAGVHLALAGALASTRALLERVEPEWSRAPADVRERWQRDRGLLAVAESVRAARTARAWEALSARNPE